MKKKNITAIIIAVLAVGLAFIGYKYFTMSKQQEPHNVFYTNTIQDFNSRLESYLGIRRASVVKVLLSDIITINTVATDNVISIIYISDSNYTGSDEETINKVKLEIKSINKYEISANYNDKGIINTIIIKERR